MDTSLSQSKQKKKKKKSAQKVSQAVSKDTLKTRKDQSNSPEAKAHPVPQLTITKKSSTQEGVAQSVARVVLSKVPQQTEKQLQGVPLVETSGGKKRKKKKKKKKPKQQLSEQQAAESLPEKPAETPESGCCKLKNLKEITCLELICPHSSKPAAKAFSAESSNAVAAAPTSSSCSQSEVVPNSLTQNHLEGLSDAIVKSLASLDKTSVSVTLVNPENNSVIGEKIVHSLQDASPGPDSEIVIDICGTSVIDLEKKEDSETSSALQDSSTMLSGGSVGGKKTGKKSKDSGTAKAVNSHIASSGNTNPQSPDANTPKVVQKQPKTKPVASQQNEALPVQAKKEKDNVANKDVASAAVVNNTTLDVTAEKTKAQLKAERKAAFEAENAARLAAQKGEGKGGAEKSKAELKAERRALQEAQRAAKTQATSEKAIKPSEQTPATGGQAGVTSTSHPSGVKKVDAAKPEQRIPPQEAPAKKAGKKPASEGKRHEVLRLFSHLHQNLDTVDHLKPYGMSGSCIHPAVFRAGLQIAEGVVVGSNARCIAMLSAFRYLVEDYTCDASKRVSQDLREQLDKNIEFLNKCRPLSVSMHNAVAFLKARISEIQDIEPVGKVKEGVMDFISRFVHEEICLAKKQITCEAQQKVMDEDVILTYCCSSLVKGVLKLAHESGKKFRVIVVDSRPQYRGREMLNYLCDLGISCTYVLITAVSYIMKEVSKVILGASTLFANGYVMGHIGTAQIALVAKSGNVPVLVCCETYKFSERVITDSFALNELGSTSQLVSSLPPNIKADGFKDLPCLSFLNLVYDVTAPQFVDVVITEKGILPCTSVPVVLRMRNTSSQ